MIYRTRIFQLKEKLILIHLSESTTMFKIDPDTCCKFVCTIYVNWIEVRIDRAPKRPTTVQLHTPLL